MDLCPKSRKSNTSLVKIYTSSFKEMSDSLELDSMDRESFIPHGRPATPSSLPSNYLPRFNDFKTIDWVNDNLQLHKREITVIKQRSALQWWNIYQIFQTYIILSIVGLCIGSVAACLNIITEYLSNIRTGYCSNAFYLNRSFCCWGELDEAKCANWITYSSFGPFNYFMFILISLAFSLTASSLVLHYAPFAAGSGISEIKCVVSGFAFDDFLSFWTFLLKSVGLPLAIASGLSVGKEGPSVHYAVCVGSVISKLFAMKYDFSNTKLINSLSYKNVLVASSAAGVAVAFGSPMGGVLFSIEEISNLFKLSTMWESYYCSLIAVSTLQLFNPFRTGQVVMFQVKLDQDWHFFEIPFYIILGAFGGIYGITIAKYNIKSVSFRKKYLGSSPLKEVAILTLLTAIVSYFNDYLKMDMTEGMQILFQNCTDEDEQHPAICQLDSKFSLFRNLSSLLIATAIRMVLIVFTYGCKVPAGIFVPSMACGATFGRALGILVEKWKDYSPESFPFSACSSDGPCISPGAYALLGAAAALSGITHLTVTVVVIMFELTGALKYIIPTMISVAVTKVINDSWGHGGIADQMIHYNGLPFIHPHEDENLQGYKVSQAMTKKVLALPLALEFGKLEKLLSETDFQNFPIVQSDGLLKGYISRDGLELAMSQNEPSPLSICIFEKADQMYDSNLDFTEYVNYAPITTQLRTSLDDILQFFHRVGPKCILVEDKGYLKGLITRKDILRFQSLVHSSHSDHSEIEREQTFSNADKAWVHISHMNDYIMEKCNNVLNRARQYRRF